MLISAITLLILGIQAADTHTLAKQAVDQSKAAETQAKVASDTFKLAFRPQLVVDIPRYTQTMPDDEVVVSFKNSGTGAASNLVSRYSVFINGQLFEQSEEVDIADFPVGADHSSTVGISKERSQRLLVGTDSLKVIVRTAYDGAPSGRTQSCTAFTYDPMARVFNPTAPYT